MSSGGGRYAYSDYGKGSVIRVKLHNFMTYKDAVLEPGPRLNLVLGPNGTGKSSFVCALCLGLAGGTTLLARAENVKEFIRRGETESFTEITLSSGEARPIVVYRRIRFDERSGGLSDWKLNGVVCAMKDVKQKMVELNVQLDNLCQFLPQDKVVEFARLSPIELLRETQKAIDDSRLADLHKELIEENRAVTSSSRERNTVAHDLGIEQERNNRMQRDVERFQNREQLLEKVRLMESKLPWIIYNREFAKMQACRQERDNAKKGLEERKQQYETSQAPIREALKKAEEANIVAKKLVDRSKKLDQQVQKLTPQGEELQQDLEAGQKSLANLDAEHRKLEAKIKHQSDEVAKKQAELDNLPPPPSGYENRRRSLIEQRRDVDLQRRAVDHELRDQKDELRQHEDEANRVKSQLTQMDNVKMQRLRALDQRLRHNGALVKAYEWIKQQSQQGRFRGIVYGPILIEVQCSDAQHIKYLEQACSMQVWQRFITVHREDQDLLLNEFGKQSSSRSIVSNYQGNPQTVITHPKGEAERYARYGITHTIDQVFEAPAVVKHVMADESNINEAYVGTAETAQQVERCLEENPGLANLWTPEAHYSTRTSMYNSKARSQSVTPVVGKGLLSGNANSQERANLQHQCQQLEQQVIVSRQVVKASEAKIAGNMEQMRIWQDEINAIDKEVKDAKDKRSLLSTRLGHQQRGLDRLRAQPDPRDKKPKLEEQLGKCSKEILKLMQDGKKGFQVVIAAMKETSVACVLDRELAAQHLALKRAGQAKEHAYRSYTENVNHLNQVLQTRRNQVKELIQKAEEKTGGRPDGELQEKLSALPDDEEELQQEMLKLRAEADGIACANPRVLQEYQQRQKKIEEMQAQLENQDQHLASQQEKIKRLHDQWYPDLKSTVKKIDTTFQRNFKDIGCAGEVSLAEHADYDKFAIQLKVKFRDEEDMNVLTANRQSGGERSVSTILYLISIQDVTVCPFRVVDEINQGMDPINERKVFMQLVESACRPGTPQCFLLTPKLLPALPFTPEVQVLQIWNGSTIKQVTGCFDKTKVIGSRKRIRAYAG